MKKKKKTRTRIPLALSETDGNAFSILGRAKKALRRAGVDQAVVDAFYAEATAGDYDALLETVERWFEVE